MPRYLPHAMAIALSIISAVSSNGAEEAGRQAEDVASVEGVDRIGLLPPGPDNPRNSEGDFIELKDDRVLFVYSHFFGGGGDHSAAHLAGRFSSDGGRTWSDEDVVVVPKEGD